MNYYKQKNHMTRQDFSHMMYLSQQNLFNYEPTYEMWKKTHEVNLNMLASIALENNNVSNSPIENIDISINLSTTCICV